LAAWSDNSPTDGPLGLEAQFQNSTIAELLETPSSTTKLAARKKPYAFPLEPATKTASKPGRR